MLTPEQVQKYRDEFHLVPAPTQPTTPPVQSHTNYYDTLDLQGKLDYIDKLSAAAQGKPYVPRFSKTPFGSSVSELPGALEETGNKFLDEANEAGAHLGEGKLGQATVEGVSSLAHLAASSVGDLVNHLIVTPIVRSSPTLQKSIQQGGESFLAAKNITGQTNAQTIEELNKAAEQHPVIAKLLRTGVDVASLFAGGEGATVGKEILEQTPRALEEGVGALAEGASAAKQAVTPIAQKVPGVRRLVEAAPEERLSTAFEDVRPDYENMTPNERRAFEAETVYEKSPTGEMTSKPRVEEGGSFGPRKINLTSGEKGAANKLAQVPDYNPRATFLQKTQTIRNDISRRAKDLVNSLGKEGVLIPKREILAKVRDSLTKTYQNSLILSKGDAAIKNYWRVVTNAIEKTEGNLEGTLNLRKIMDDTYENTRGNKAFTSDKIGALDELHRAARDTLNKLLISKAKNTAVKQSLQDQTELYNIMDTLRDKASKEEMTAFGRLKQKYPKTATAAKLVAGSAVAGAGLGGGAKIINAFTGGNN